MSSIATNKNQVTLYYNSKTSLGKQTLSYVESSEKPLKTIDISKTKVTGTQWSTIADKLNTTIDKLINTAHPDFKNEYDTKPSLSQQDWIKVLIASPQVLKCSILISEKNYYLVETPSMILKLLNVEEKDTDRQHEN